MGGWTDTWFGQPGAVVSVAVAPGAEVTVFDAEGPGPVVLNVESFTDRYVVEPGAHRASRHPLLEAAVDALPPPPGVPVEIVVRSVVPAGSGTGTSAAVAVALIGALTALRGDKVVPRDAASLAHRLEVEVCGEESGVQDQLAAAFGGLNYLRIDRYPEAEVEALPPWDELGPCLSLVYLGRPHDSSAIHRQVIRDATEQGPVVFERLRRAAEEARLAVLARDPHAYGRALVAGNEAMASLHPGLVGADARRVIEEARARGALGWKVNGAGGEGGSVGILNPDAAGKRVLEAALAALSPSFQVLPVRVSSEGLTVTIIA